MRENPGIPAPAARQRNTPWFEDAVVPASIAWLGGPTWEGFVNTPASSDPNGVVQELRATFETARFQAEPPPAPPAPVRAWLDQVEQALFAARYLPRANYASQQHEVYMSLGAFGTAALFVGRRAAVG